MSHCKDCFIVFMGGSGSMVLESLIHMSALSLMDTDRIHALMLDVDSGNGNVSRTKKTFEAYEALHDSFDGSGPKDFFQTKIKLYIWLPASMEKHEYQTLRGLINNQPDADWLSRALYTQAEIEHTVPVGFKGHPNLGVLFMQNLLDSAGAIPTIQDFLKAFEASDTHKIMFVGSSFGGTGAASIPVFGEYLRNRISAQKRQSLSFALLLMEPYFDIHPSANDQQLDPLNIDSLSFDDKIKTVLNYYPKELFARDKIESIYQHVYLLGSPNRVQFDSYSTGTSNQCNPSNLIVWFACTAIKQFYCDLILPKDPNLKTQLYIPWLTASTWEWDQFSADVFPSLEKKSAQLLQAGILYACRLYSPVKLLPSVVPYEFLERLLIGLDAQDRIIFKNEFSIFTEYLSKFVNWYFQIVTHLPDDPKYSIQTTDNPVEQEERFRRDEEFLSFHQTTEEKIQRAFDELCPAVPNMNSSDEQKPGRESVAITNHLLYSIIHQKFFNAFLLCKLEQMRILYWPFEDDKREDTSPEELLLLIIFRSSQNKYRGNDDIANGPLGACINHITQSQFLDVTTTVDWLMAYISEMSLADNAPPKQRYVSLIRNLFSAIERFQS